MAELDPPRLIVSHPGGGHHTAVRSGELADDRGHRFRRFCPAECIYLCHRHAALRGRSVVADAHQSEHQALTHRLLVIGERAIDRLGAAVDCAGQAADLLVRLQREAVTAPMHPHLQ